LKCVYFSDLKARHSVQVLNQAENLHDLSNIKAGTEMGEVIKDFMTFTAGVETLRHFAMLNLQAVIKITKKHDKHSDVTLQSDLVQVSK